MRLDMIAAGIVFFQDRDGLKRTLDSLGDFDLVIAIDGAFATFKSESRISTDGSRELCRKYPNARLFNVVDQPEPDKRSFYLQYAGMTNSDHLVIIDSDEWIEGDMQEFRRGLPEEPGIYCLDYANFENQHYPSPRLVCRPGNFVYHHAHNIMKNLQSGETFALRGDSARLISGVTMRSDSKLRSRERVQASNTYKEILFKQEREMLAR